MLSCESRALIQSQWSLWVTRTAAGLVTLCHESHSSGHVEADGCPLTSFSRRQSCAATGIEIVEYYAMCSSIAEELLHLRSILEHVGFRVSTTLFCDSVAARGIAQRARLRHVKGSGGEDAGVARSCS